MMRRPIARAVRPGPGLVGTAARTAVVAGTATAVTGRVARRQAGRAAAEAAPPAPAPTPEPSPAAAADPVPATGPSMVEQLQQLAALRDQGILTDEEFAAQKQKILDAS